MQTFDYIVVGSGSSGGILAARLTENPDIHVLVLEAGPCASHWTLKIPAATRNNYAGGPRNWCFETEPELHMNNRRIFQPRGKVIGGSSSINGMVYVRGHREDFQAWERSGAYGWGYDGVLPYFRSLENYIPGANEFRGSSGPINVDKLGPDHSIEQAFLDGAAQAGYPLTDDYNGEEQEGVSGFDANIGYGYRSGTAALLRKVMNRPNLVVQGDSRVTRVLIDNNRATGVEYHHSGKLCTVHCEAEIILSAGTFQSPQLLMLSGIGPKEELKTHNIPCIVNSSGVGQNLHDHLEVHMMHSCSKGMSNNKLLRKDRIFLSGIQWLLFKTGPAATTHSRVGGFLRTDDSVEYPNMQFHFWPFYLEGWSPPPNKDGYCFDVGPVRTKSRGWVKLRSADPLDSPRILLNGLSLEQDLCEFRQCIRMAREIASQTAFDFCRGPEISPGPDVRKDAEIDEYVRKNANSAYHPVGTCKMGVDPMAVVDSELRVYGVQGLRVVDASIMPTIPNGNTNAPSLMIGEKAASIILGTN